MDLPDIYIVETLTVAGEQARNCIGWDHQQPFNVMVDRRYFVIDQSRIGYIRRQTGDAGFVGDPAACGSIGYW